MFTSTIIVIEILGIVAACLGLMLYRQHRSLQSSLELMADALDHVSIACFIYNEKGILTRWNRPALELTDDAILFDFDHCCRWSSMQDGLFRKSIDDDSLSPLIQSSLIPDQDRDPIFSELIRLGTERIGRAKAYRLKGGMIILCIEDISRRASEKTRYIALKTRYEDLFNAIDLASLGFAVISVTPDGVQTHFLNPSFCNLLRNPAQLQNPGDILTYIPPDQRDDFMTKARQSLDGIGAVSFEFPLTLPDGYQEWRELRLWPQKNGSGARLIAMLSDKTAQKLQTFSLAHMQRIEALGQLAGGIAHDFNNILSIVDGYARMLEKRHPDPMLGSIRQAVGRGTALTQQLLSFGRHTIDQKNAIDLNQTIRDQEGILTLLATQEQIALSFLYHDGGALSVECSADIIGQIVMNLVRNACDASPRDGSVMVEIYKASATESFTLLSGEHTLGMGYVCISVMDQGHGIDKETATRLFEPFYTTKEAGKGTGLGLSILYNHVKALGGGIDVHSRPGEGALFKIYLPLSHRAPVSASPSRRASASDGDLTGRSVLVVEDEDDLRHIMAETLQEAGMTVITAKDGDDALDQQDRFEGVIDFMISDVIMPHLNGIALAEIIEEIRPDTKIILVSGYPSQGEHACMDLPDRFPFLSKPVHYESLLQRLRDLCRDHQPPHAQGRGDLYGDRVWISNQTQH